MESGSTDSANQEDISLSLDSIIGISEGWLTFLSRRESRVRLAKAFLTAVLVWSGIFAAFLAVVLEEDSLAYFPAHPGTTLIVSVSLLLVGGACAGAVYAFLGRKTNPKLQELYDLVAQTKAKRGVGGNSGGTTDRGITGSALLETEKLLDLLPQLVRTRNQDSLLFGIVAFVVASVVARPPIGILVGVIVWLYFRYETNRMYDRQLSKVEEQKRVFEQRKEQFLSNL